MARRGAQAAVMAPMVLTLAWVLALAAVAALMAAGAGRAQAPDPALLAQAASAVGADGLRIDDPDRRWLEAAKRRHVGETAAAQADPRMIREYRDMDRRQRLMVIAALAAALICMVGGLLMWRERQLRRTVPPPPPPAVAPEPEEPVRALINDLGRAIRAEANTHTPPAEAKKDNSPTLEAALEAAAGAARRPSPSPAAAPRRAASARNGDAQASPDLASQDLAARSLDAYFSELRCLRRDRPRIASPLERHPIDRQPVERQPVERQSLERHPLERQMGRHDDPVRAASSPWREPRRGEERRALDRHTQERRAQEPRAQERRIEDRHSEEQPKSAAPRAAERARVWPSPPVSAYPLARRRAHAARMAERLGRFRADPAARASEPHAPGGESRASQGRPPQNRPPEDRVENILYRVRALGRMASEERRRRENAVRRPPAG